MNKSILQVVVAIQHNHKPFYVFKPEGNRDFTAQVIEKSWKAEGSAGANQRWTTAEQPPQLGWQDLGGLCSAYRKSR